MYQDIINLINTYIKANGVGAITGARLNQILNMLANYYGFDDVTVTTLPAGSDATATVEGRTLKLGIPQGDVGLNPNRGTYVDIDDAPTTGQNGDYLVIIDELATPVTGELYVWNGSGWSPTGYSAELGVMMNYSDLVGKPTINGIVIEGDHDSEYYALLPDVVKPFIYTKTVYTREDLLAMPLLDYSATSGGKVYGTSLSSKHIMIPVEKGNIVEVVASSAYGTTYCYIDELDHPTSGGTLDAVGDEIVVQVPAGSKAVITIPEGCHYLYSVVGTQSSTYQYCADRITIYRNVKENEIETTVDYTESANLLDPDKVKLKYSLSNADGLIISIASSTKGVTDYIPVTSEGLYCANAVMVGANPTLCVYDENKNFLRYVNNTLVYTYQEGDGFARFVVDMSVSVSNRIIVRGTSSIGNFGALSFKLPLEQKFIEGLSMKEESVPSARPARGANGVGILSVSADTLTDGSLNTGSNDLNTIRPMSNIAVAAKIATFNAIEVGQGYNSDQGWAVKINATNIILGRYSNNAFVSQQTKPHGLTIESYVKVEILRNGMKAKVRLMTKGGGFIDDFDSEGTSYATAEKYGRAFVYADSTTSLTDVKLSHTPVGLKKPVWFIGASYMSLYDKRLTTQLIKTFGVDNFTIIGIPGYDSGQVFEMLSNALKYGCPRYVVWGPGMNDSTVIKHRVWLVEAIKLSKKYGFDFIGCKIPYPENQSTHAITSKAGINTDIDMYCDRWIDLFAAVSEDAAGHWYDGYHDTDDPTDDKHPSVLGAKAMAAQVLTDFPEIANY